MTNIEISENFTIEDIHKIRDYNFEKIQTLSDQERKDYYKNKAQEFLKAAEITPLSKDKAMQAAH